jgi:hypothetical protein
MVAAAGAFCGLVLATASLQRGVGMMLVPAVLVIAALLVLRADVLLLAVLVTTILFEADDQSVFNAQQRFYDPVVGIFSITDGLIVLLALAVVVTRVRQRTPLRLPGLLTLPLLALAVATLAGLVAGRATGASITDLYGSAVPLLYLMTLPLIVVNVVPEHLSYRTIFATLTGLVAVKAAIGMLNFAASGAATAAGNALTYYEPTANWLSVLFVMAVLACALRRVPLPWWAWGTLPLAVAELVLSFRRSFWIAAVVGLAFIIVLAVRPQARRIVVPTVAVIGAILWIVLSSVGSTTVSSSPVVERAISLQPSRLAANAEDRYRIDERRNVLENLRESPIVGLGMTVPWTVREPVGATSATGGNTYVHFVSLWFWMKLGLLGLAAYIAVMASALWMSFRVSRRHPSALVRASALGFLAALAGLIVAETTASFTGVDYRFSILLGVLLGCVAAASLELGARIAPDAPSLRDPAGHGRG